MSIDILMSTYNGERFIRDQLDSIFNQNIVDWRLIIRDDGSSDATCQIISEYQKKNPGKILVVEDAGENLGACQSFFRLMPHSTAKYIFFCDQDDIWVHDKMEMQIHAMQKIEATSVKGCPILVHSDLKVVNEHQELISESFWQYQKIRPNQMRKLNRVLVQNYVTGCTMLINNPLLEFARSGVTNPIMHDWWILLIATAKGKVVTMEKATVFYRQHAENEIGAVRWSLLVAVKKMITGKKLLHDSLSKTKRQAEGLLDSGILPGEPAEIVKRYVDMYKKKYCVRRIEWFRMRFFKYGFLRNIAMFFLI